MAIHDGLVGASGPAVAGSRGEMFWGEREGMFGASLKVKR
jgi:hypothetical protein